MAAKTFPPQSSQRVYAALHVVGEVAAVGAGIGAELLFGEALQVIQRLLRRVPKQAVRIPLEGGQVVERRGFLRLFRLHDGANSGGFAVAVSGKPLRLCLLLHAFACGGEAVKVQMDGVEGLRLKGAYFRFPLHQQCKRGRCELKNDKDVRLEDLYKRITCLVPDVSR